MQPTDTIIAVSSPPGRSPRGLIRISGPATAAVLSHLLNDTDTKPRELAPVRLRQPNIPALLLRFDGPASYTGDDCAELQLPGNAALLDRVLHDAIQLQGVRLAEPGEFTFRAYTAGKIDLTQAEGIGATISAVSDSQLSAATLLRQGKLGQTAETLVDQLGNLLALVEAGIDFTDQDDVTPIAPGNLAEKVGSLHESLSALLSRSRSWGAIEALPRVVLVGPPSAGKSTLFNALLGKERATIASTPGTTRDALAEPLQLTDPGGRVIEVMLVDLAGLDDPQHNHALAPDRQAQVVAHNAIQQADLLLRLSDDASQWISLESQAITIDVLTKCDDPASHNPNSPHRKMAVQATDDSNPHLAVGANVAPRDASHVINVSAVTGENLDALRQAIVNALADKAVSLQADLLALQPRHEQAITTAGQALQDTCNLLEPYKQSPQLPDIELLANCMRDALDALASLGGQLTPDEVIGRVFATFCVGK